MMMERKLFGCQNGCQNGCHHQTAEIPSCDAYAWQDSAASPKHGRRHPGGESSRVVKRLSDAALGCVRKFGPFENCEGEVTRAEELKGEE